MAHTPPFHSARQSDPPVYHNNTSCTDAIRIELGARKPGTDNRPLCEQCARLL